MSILTQIFSSGASELVKGVGGIIDNLHTSKEEKLAAEQKVKELIASYEVQMEKEISSRWNADMKSDSWLSKNTRPLALAFLTLSSVFIMCVDSFHMQFEVDTAWVDLLKTLLVTVYVAYFGSRGAEKITNLNKK